MNTLFAVIILAMAAVFAMSSRHGNLSFHPEQDCAKNECSELASLCFDQGSSNNVGMCARIKRGGSKEQIHM